MRIVEYTPDQFEALAGALRPAHPHSALCHRPFVDYYYASSEHCRLYLLLGKADQICGTIGIERLQLACGSELRTGGFGSNFLSLQPGAGAFLFMHWMKSFPVGIVSGATEDTHRLIGHLKWRYYPGVKTWYSNRAYTTLPGEGASRAAAKRVLRLVRPPRRMDRQLERLPADWRHEVTVEEVGEFTEDLLPRQSPFTLRLAPALAHLRWRYALDLSFVRHRWYRVARNGRPSGYVILNDARDEVNVAQADGDDPRVLALGIVLSMGEATRNDAVPRECLVLASHPEMQAVLRQSGFRMERPDRAFAVGNLCGGIELPSDTGQWLVHYGWGDGGLRMPFCDQHAA